jgi:mono/diheme cytochrome c family protein
MNTLFAACALACIAVALPASAQKMTLSGSSGEGRVIFHSPAVGANGLSCFDCHDDFQEGRKDGLRRSGHSLYNAAGRQTFWGQDPESPNVYSNIANASVVCVKHFMRSPDKLTAQQLLSLQAYLQSITRQWGTSALALSPGADKTGEYAHFDGGDRIRGRELFYAACHVCHPNGNAGIAPAPLARDKDPSYYARKIREGDGLGAVLAGIDPNAYDPTSGEFMPFYGADILTNRDIRDLIAHIKSLPPPTK